MTQDHYLDLSNEVLCAPLYQKCQDEETVDHCEQHTAPQATPHMSSLSYTSQLSLVLSRGGHSAIKGENFPNPSNFNLHVGIFHLNEHYSLEGEVILEDFAPEQQLFFPFERKAISLIFQ